MHISELLALEPFQLAQMIPDALNAENEEMLKDIDFALHHIFIHSRKADNRFTNIVGLDKKPNSKLVDQRPNSKLQFIEALLLATDFVRRGLSAPVASRQRLFVRWQHLAELVEAFRNDYDRLSDARLLIESRTKAPAILAILKSEMARGTPGLKVKDLAARVNMSPSGLVPLLDDLEEVDIVERHPFGKFVFIQLGLVGQLLGENHERIVKPATGAERSPDLLAATSNHAWIERYANTAPALT